MFKITIKIEGPASQDDRGYERRDDLATFTAEGQAENVWEVYRDVVEALTPQATVRYLTPDEPV